MNKYCTFLGRASAAPFFFVGFLLFNSSVIYAMVSFNLEQHIIEQQERIEARRLASLQQTRVFEGGMPEIALPSSVSVKDHAVVESESARIIFSAARQSVSTESTILSFLVRSNRNTMRNNQNNNHHSADVQSISEGELSDTQGVQERHASASVIRISSWFSGDMPAPLALRDRSTGSVARVDEYSRVMIVRRLFDSDNPVHVRFNRDHNGDSKKKE